MNLDKILIPNRLAVRISKLAFGTPDPSCELTWEEGFDFFRKEKGCFFSIELYLDLVAERYYGYEYYIEVYLKDGSSTQSNEWFETYEEAREACLEKLILIKEGNYDGMSRGIDDDKVEGIRIKFLQDCLNDPEKMSKIETKSISDGYHNFGELYEYRKLYNALLFNEWGIQLPENREAVEGVFTKNYVHKSWKHYDGEWCFGEPKKWFIVCAKLDSGIITNHYKAEDWDLFKIPETEKCIFEYDGHTPQDVLVRMKTEAEKDNFIEKMVRNFKIKENLRRKEIVRKYKEENGEI